jgi:hypothetical protein
MEAMDFQYIGILSSIALRRKILPPQERSVFTHIKILSYILCIIQPQSLNM